MKKATCGFCKGKGKVILNIGERVCSSCKGTGKIDVPDSSIRCSKCKGTGKIGWRKCGVCEATGWVKK